MQGGACASRPGILRRLTLSLRLRLILLVLAGVVPLTVFSLADEYIDYEAEVQRTSREKLQLARSVAIAIDNELQRCITALQVLAQSRRLREGDLESFRARADSVIAEQFPGANILLLRPDGQQMMNTAMPPGGTLPARRDLDTINRVVATGRPVVSGVFTDAVARRPVVAIDVPVKDEDGRILSVLSLNPPADAFVRVIEQHRPPGQWTVTVLDRQTTIVARSPGGQGHVGGMVNPALSARILTGREGVLDSVSRDGVPILAVFTRRDAFGWTVLIGIPRAELTEPAIASVLHALAFGAVLLITGLALAMWVAHQISEPIGTLRQLAATIGRDTMAFPASTGLRETDDVAAALQAAQTQRHSSDRRYRTLFDANPHAMAVYDLGTLRFLEVNDAVVRHYGWSRDELLAMSLFDVCAPEEASRLRTLNSGPPRDLYSMRHQRKDGTTIDVEAVVRIIDYDGRRVGLTLVQDVTDHKLARARLAEAIDAFPGSFRLYDRDERLILTNGKSWAPTDSGLNAQIGQTIEATVRIAADIEAYAAGVGRKEAWYRERLAQFRHGRTDAEVKTRDGRWHQLVERRTADGGTISVRLDITAHKAVEEQLRQSQKMETVGQLTGGIAHDFNNSLAVIMASFEDIIDIELEGTDVHTCAETGLKATEQAAALTNRLLAFSRRQELAPVELDIGKVVKDLHKILRSTVPPAIELTVRTAPDLRRCVLDRTQLETAVMNMVVNARDAVGEKGVIGVELDNRSIGEHEAAQSAAIHAGEWVVVSISDDGTGMSADVQTHIFEPFFTTKEVGKGTGLGLSQIHGFVAQSGGFVTVQSELGQGTRVSLHFPALA